jgi:protein phosphatase 1 regulatory subunit 7
VDHLKKLKDIYFVQNKISTIENLDGLSSLRNLELGGNRIRVVLSYKLWARSVANDRSRL